MDSVGVGDWTEVWAIIATKIETMIEKQVSNANKLIVKKLKHSEGFSFMKTSTSDSP